MRYPQYTDNTQLYISIAGELSDALDVLSQCLEAAAGLDGGQEA